MSGIPRSEKPRLKVILVGSSGVGKTCLISAFLKKPFDPSGLSTVSPAYMFQEVTRRDGLVVCLQIWDTAGQERYHSVSQLFYRDSDVALVCFEAGSEESMDSVPDWVTRVRKEVADCELIFVATKSDQITAPGQRERVIDAAQQALGCISSKGMYLTSAANGDGVDELFRAAAELYVPNKGVRIDKGKPLQGTEAPSPCC